MMQKELSENLEYYEEDDEIVEDDAIEKEESAPVIYDITSFGADYNVDYIVKRMDQEVFIVPDFQRSFVWPQKKASRFIESLMLGLPVPSVFLYKEEETNKYLIVDGQQRLKTIQKFFKGVFGERKFRLQDVQEKWNGKTIHELSDFDRQCLEDAMIHFIIFKQENPSEDNSSIYHVFERLNTGGMALNPQEIRNCVSHGPFVDLLEELNKNEFWRKIYGRENKRYKDRELILRFLALLNEHKKYQRPMNEFLNKFMHKHRNISLEQRQKFSEQFNSMIQLAYETVGTKVFRPERNLNAAVFDAAGIAFYEASQSDTVRYDTLNERYFSLLKDEAFANAYSRSTADEKNVLTRISKAKEYLVRIP